MDEGQRISHSYLVSGIGEETHAKAMELCRTMLCTSPGKRPCNTCAHCRKALRGIHPDLISVVRLTDDEGKLKKEIVVDQIREVIRSAVELPNEAAKKVYYFPEAGALNGNAQNALLKLLEEPPSFVGFVLECQAEGQLLETVRSRCRSVTVNGLPPETGADLKEKGEEYIALAARKDPLALLVYCHSLESMTNAEALAWVECCRELVTDCLCMRRDSGGLTRKELWDLLMLLEKAATWLHSNVSTKHTLGLLSVKTIPQA